MKNFRNQTRNAVISTALAAGIMLGISGCDFKPTEVFSESSVPAISQSSEMPSQGENGLKFGDPVKQEATQVVFNLADLKSEELQVFNEVLNSNLTIMSTLQQDYLKAAPEWKATGHVAITGHKVYENEKQFMIFNGDEVLTTESKTGIDMRSDTGDFYTAAGMQKLFGRSALTREDGVRVMIAAQTMADDYVDCDTVIMDGVKVSGDTKQSVVGSWIKLGAITKGELNTIDQVKNKAVENGAFGKELVKVYSSNGLSVFGSVEGAVSISMNNMLLPKVGAAVVNDENGIRIDAGELSTSEYDMITNTKFQDKLDDDQRFKSPEFVVDGVVVVKNGAPDGTDTELVAMKADTNGNVTLNLQLLTKMVGLQFVVTESEAGNTLEIVDDTLINRMMYQEDLGTIAEGEVSEQFREQMNSIKINMEQVAAEKYAAQQATQKAKVEEQQKVAREEAEKKKQEQQKEQEKEQAQDQGQADADKPNKPAGGEESSGSGQGSKKEPALESTMAGKLLAGGGMVEIGDWNPEIGAWWATDSGGMSGWLFPNGGFISGL